MKPDVVCSECGLIKSNLGDDYYCVRCFEHYKKQEQEEYAEELENKVNGYE